MYHRPKIELLNDSGFDDEKYMELAEECNSRIISCLRALKINVEKKDYCISPVNMVFDYKLLQGSSYRKVKNVAADISLAVSSEVKIFQNVNESNVFSVSVPMRNRISVGLGYLLSCEEFKRSDSPLTIAVGIDELGRNVVLNLAEAPHLLISGTTGSGKTVFLDDIIMSLVFKTPPTKVKLVLVDPGADMNVYEGLPHLMLKPVSEKWDVFQNVLCVRNRMNERFERLAEAGVRNIETYNQNHITHMPHIVLIIDKYLEYTREMPLGFEDCVKEIARKGRAAGVHLIINTQTARPEIVNSDIKNNIPCRVSFSVTDWHESKAILDKTGAQKLLGNGDMLFLSGYDASLLHVQAPIVGFHELENVVNYMKMNNKKVEYLINLEDVREPIDDNVDFVIKVLDTIQQVRTVDVYSIQHKFDVNFAEASDVIKFLEENRVISKFEGSKGRTVDHQVAEILLEQYKSELAQQNEDGEE